MMSSLFFTSDWHLGHRNMRMAREKHDDVLADQHDELLFDNYLSVVTRRDVVWFLGDMITTTNTEEYRYYLTRLQALPGDKRLILGNHCTDHMSGMAKPEHLSSVFSQIHSMRRMRRGWITHAPMHPQELRGLINIHGHTHWKNILCTAEAEDDKRYVNVCVEQTEYTPLRYQGWLQDHAQRMWENYK